MIICKKCSTQLEDGSKFCFSCGAMVEITPSCKQCGNPISEDSVFCQYCGAPVTEKVLEEPPIPATEVTSEAVEVTAPEPIPTEIAATMSEAIPTTASVTAPATTPVPDPGNIVPAQNTVPVPSTKSTVVPTPVPSNIPSTVPINKAVKDKKPVQEKKPGKPLPKIMIAAAAVIAVIILAIVVPKVISNFSKEPKGLLYLKDGELNYTSLSKIKPKEITEKLYRGGSFDNYDFYDLPYAVSLCKDGKRLFYPDKTSSSDEGITLYYRDINSKKEGKKIDSDVIRYKANEDGTKVIYIKGYDRDLYISKLSDKDKIDSDVDTFYMNASGSKLVYITMDGEIYIKDGKKDKEKIESDASIVEVSSDLETIYYLKEGSLYVKKGDKDEDKIASEVSSVVNVYDSGELYFLKMEEEQISLMDFVNDDMKEADAAMIEPLEPWYPYREDFKPNMEQPVEPYYYDYFDFWGEGDSIAYDTALNEYYAANEEYNRLWDEAYNAAYEQYELDYEAYQEEMTDYYEKQDRDYLRESIAGNTISQTNYSLYYYDSKDVTKITDTYSAYLNYSYFTPVIAYENFDQKEITKVSLSEVEYYDDVYNMAMEALASSKNVYVAMKAETVVLDQKNSSNYYITDSGDKIYYLNNYDSDSGTGDLLVATISASKIGKAEEIDDDVYSYIVTGAKDTLVYYKNVRDSSGDMYKDGKKLDKDVYIYSIQMIGDTDTFVYYTDYSYDSEEGTLKLIKGKDSKEIADDVHAYIAFSEKSIVYLQDYNLQKYEGDAYLYNGSKKSKEIDEDVNKLIPVDNYGYKGQLNYEW